MTSSVFCPLSKAYPHMVYDNRPQENPHYAEHDDPTAGILQRVEGIEGAIYALEDRIGRLLAGVQGPQNTSAPTRGPSFIVDLFPDERDRTKVGKLVTWILIGCLAVLGLVVFEKLHRLLSR